MLDWGLTEYDRKVDIDVPETTPERNVDVTIGRDAYETCSEIGNQPTACSRTDEKLASVG
jgi:hypothetical protein